MTITHFPKSSIDSKLLNLTGLMHGLWEAAFIFDRKWQAKKEYAEKTLKDVENSIEEIDKDHHEYVLIKEMEFLYNPSISYRDLSKYISMIKNGEYEIVMKELNKEMENLTYKFRAFLG